MKNINSQTWEFDPPVDKKQAREMRNEIVGREEMRGHLDNLKEEGIICPGWF